MSEIAASAALAGRGGFFAHVETVLGWRATTAEPTLPLRGVGATLNGVFHLTSGGNHWGYDPNTETWTAYANVSYVADFRATCAHNGKLYVQGGYPGRTDLQAYDPTTNVWTSMDVGWAFQNHAMVGFGNSLYLCGGLAYVIRFHLDTVSPEALSHPGFPEGVRGVVVDGKIYFQGGYGSGMSLTMLDPATQTFTAMADAPHHHAEHLLVAWKGQIWAIGGWNSVSGFSDSIDVYDPATNTWTSSLPYPYPVTFPHGDVVGGKLLVAGGDTP